MKQVYALKFVFWIHNFYIITVHYGKCISQYKSCLGQILHFTFCCFRPNFIQYIPNQFLHVGLANIKWKKLPLVWKEFRKGIFAPSPRTLTLLNFTTEIRLIVYYSVVWHQWPVFLHLKKYLMHLNICHQQDQIDLAK